MDRGVIFSPTSIKDLADSVSYISRFDPTAAARLGDSLIEAAEKMLGEHPYAGPVCPEYPDGPYRYWLHRGYRIVYQISENENRVEILRFWHCAQGDVPLTKE